MKNKNILRVFIILIIIFIITGITPPKNGPPIDKVKIELIEPKMLSIESAIDAFKLNTGKLPIKLEDLIYCPNEIKDIWKGPYLKEKNYTILGIILTFIKIIPMIQITMF
jgi:general secretion pathway protein G